MNAAKSLQSCLTLCDPMDCSLPGFSVHGILQARTLEWVAISFSWKILKEMGIPDHLICLLRICTQIKKQQLEPDMEQQTGSKLGKEYVKAIYCHPGYLTYMHRVHHAKCWGG